MNNLHPRYVLAITHQTGVIVYIAAPFALPVWAYDRLCRFLRGRTVYAPTPATAAHALEGGHQVTYVLLLWARDVVPINGGGGAELCAPSPVNA